MKQPCAQNTYQDLRTHGRRISHIRKADESLIQETVQTAALDRVLKHHAKYCTYWIFSGDRHCSCGRDEAVAELDRMRGRLRAVMNMQQPKPTDF